MEIKKSPKADLENKRSMFVLIGFVLVFAVLYIGLEWSQKERTRIVVIDEFLLVGDDDMVLPTTHDNIPPPPPPAPIDVIASIIDIVDNTVETKAPTIVDPESTGPIEIPTVIAPPKDDEDIETVFVKVDDPPSFPGGEKALMEFLSKNIRYPTIAIETGIQGTVILTFVVNRDGQIVDVEIVRGVHDSLDKEAVRVVRSMPAWKPGKQHGKAVRTRFNLPVRFSIR